MRAVTKRKKHPALKASLVSLLVAALIFALVLAAFSALSDRAAADILHDRYFYLTFVVACGIVLVAFLMIYRVDAKHVVMGENDLEDSDFLPLGEMKKYDEFDVSRARRLSRRGDGTVIGAKRVSPGPWGKFVNVLCRVTATGKQKKDDVLVTTTTQLHSLIVGTSGTGKTTGFVDQNIALLSSTATKPSMVITDPKKELCHKHSRSLAARGYDVYVIDLRSPYTSLRWNPFDVLIRRVRRIKELDGCVRDELWYIAGTDVFRSEDEIEICRQQCMDELCDSAKDIVHTLCPIKNKEQANWEMGARDLIEGFLLAMCEDVIEGRLEEKELILFNLYHNVSSYCSEDTTMLKNYLMERDEYSKVRGLVNTVLVTSERTLTSYLSDVNAYMQQFADDGVLAMTSSNEIDLFSLDERPSAVFVVVPDEKETRHSFVTLFIDQLYKELVEKCNRNLLRGETHDAVLKRNMYFVLDEFGNIPALNGMSGMISVARSRGMRFLLVLQSLTQLDARYGKETAAAVKDNCSVKIFIGSDDVETKKQFSELCGQKKIKTVSVNTGSGESPSSHTGAMNKPLVSEGMLQLLNGDTKGDAIVCVRGYPPIWSRFTPSYKLKDVYFPSGFGETRSPAPRAFRKEELGFDIADRLPPKRSVREAENAYRKYYNAVEWLSEHWDEEYLAAHPGSRRARVEGETGDARERRALPVIMTDADRAAVVEFFGEETLSEISSSSFSSSSSSLFSSSSSLSASASSSSSASASSISSFSAEPVLAPVLAPAHRGDDASCVAPSDGESPYGESSERSKDGVSEDFPLPDPADVPGVSEEDERYLRELRELDAGLSRDAQTVMLRDCVVFDDFPKLLDEVEEEILRPLTDDARGGFYAGLSVELCDESRDALGKKTPDESQSEPPDLGADVSASEPTGLGADVSASVPPDLGVSVPVSVPVNVPEYGPEYGSEYGPEDGPEDG